MTLCTAPQRGHNTRKSRLRCPVHGPVGVTRSLPALTPQTQRNVDTCLAQPEFLLNTMNLSDVPPEVLHEFVHSSDERILVGLARSRTASDTTLIELSKSPNKWVCYQLAANDVAPDEAIGRAYATAAHTVDAKQGVLVRSRVAARLGVARKNVEAITMLAEMNWWELEKSDPQVAIVLAVHQNP